jgi:hypothetical protein
VIPTFTAITLTSQELDYLGVSTPLLDFNKIMITRTMHHFLRKLQSAFPLEPVKKKIHFNFLAAGITIEFNPNENN